MNTLKTSVSFTTSDHKAMTMELATIYNSVASRAHIPDEELHKEAESLLLEQAQKTFSAYSAADLENITPERVKEISKALMNQVNEKACDDMWPVRIGPVTTSIAQPSFA